LASSTNPAIRDGDSLCAIETSQRNEVDSIDAVFSHIPTDSEEADLWSLELEAALQELSGF
jgi:hypothetical protein